MQVQEVMTSNVEIVEASNTLQMAAQKMRERDVGILPVHDGGKAVGMVTDRDIAVRGVAEGLNPANATVREVMTPEIAWLKAGQDISEAAKLMEEKMVRRALVLGEDNTIAGIVSVGDLAVRVPSAEKSIGGEVLEHVAQPDA